MKYKPHNIVVYFFSGTGNAMFAAKQIALLARQNDIPVQIFNIADNTIDYDKISGQSLVIFCYPTHGFNAPPVVLKFISGFPKNKAFVYLINTRAGMKLFNIHTPGLGGIALWLPSILLFIKGYRLVGWQPLDLPSNWISLHPGLRHKAIAFIQQRCSKTLEVFSKKAFEIKPVYTGLYWLPIDICLLPISVAYYFFGRFAIAKTFYANYKCTDCGLCIRQCPVGAIKDKNARPYWTFQCESCMKCMNNCPHRAIETAHGYTFLLWWIAFSAIPYGILKILENGNFLSEEFIRKYNQLISYSLMILTGLIIIFSGYQILHQLLRIKFINKIISYTSLTHYKFWRRYHNQT